MPDRRRGLGRHEVSQVKNNIKPPRCPLVECKGAFMDVQLARKSPLEIGFLVFVCDKDRIAIRVDDPFVGKWEQAAHNSGGVPCPNPSCDGRKMRYFATQTGFMKAVCPKCKVAISNAEPDRHDLPGGDEKTPEKPGVLQ